MYRNLKNNAAHSKKTLPNGAYIPGELLLAALNGKLTDDDYLGQSTMSLQKYVFDEPDIDFLTASRKEREEAGFPFNERFKMIYPGYLPMENGYTQLADGTWFIATITDMGRCSGDMLHWWINNCDSTERFHWAHPHHNRSGQWNPTFYGTPACLRDSRHYVGHRFYAITKLAAESFTAASGAPVLGSPTQSGSGYDDFGLLHKDTTARSAAGRRPSSSSTGSGYDGGRAGNNIRSNKSGSDAGSAHSYNHGHEDWAPTPDLDENDHANPHNLSPGAASAAKATEHTFTSAGVHHLQYEYLNPGDYFNVHEFRKQGVTAVVLIRLSRLTKTPPAQTVAEDTSVVTKAEKKGTGGVAAVLTGCIPSFVGEEADNDPFAVTDGDNKTNSKGGGLVALVAAAASTPSPPVIEAIGYILHVMRSNGGRNELRSRVWLKPRTSIPTTTTTVVHLEEPISPGNVQGSSGNNYSNSMNRNRDAAFSPQFGGSSNHAGGSGGASSASDTDDALFMYNGMTNPALRTSGKFMGENMMTSPRSGAGSPNQKVVRKKSSGKNSSSWLPTPIAASIQFVYGFFDNSSAVERIKYSGSDSWRPQHEGESQNNSTTDGGNKTHRNSKAAQKRDSLHKLHPLAVSTDAAHKHYLEYHASEMGHNNIAYVFWRHLQQELVGIRSFIVDFHDKEAALQEAEREKIRAMDEHAASLGVDARKKGGLGKTNSDSAGLSSPDAAEEAAKSTGIGHKIASKSPFSKERSARILRPGRESDSESELTGFGRSSSVGRGRAHSPSSSLGGASSATSRIPSPPTHRPPASPTETPLSPSAAVDVNAIISKYSSRRVRRPATDTAAATGTGAGMGADAAKGAKRFFADDKSGSRDSPATVLSRATSKFQEDLGGRRPVRRSPAPSLNVQPSLKDMISPRISSVTSTALAKKSDRVGSPTSSPPTAGSPESLGGKSTSPPAVEPGDAGVGPEAFAAADRVRRAQQKVGSSPDSPRSRSPRSARGPTSEGAGSRLGDATIDPEVVDAVTASLTRHLSKKNDSSNNSNPPSALASPRDAAAAVVTGSASSAESARTHGDTESGYYAAATEAEAEAAADAFIDEELQQDMLADPVQGIEMSREALAAASASASATATAAENLDVRNEGVARHADWTEAHVSASSASASATATAADEQHNDVGASEEEFAAARAAAAAVSASATAEPVVPPEARPEVIPIASSAASATTPTETPQSVISPTWSQRLAETRKKGATASALHRSATGVKLPGATAPTPRSMLRSATGISPQNDAGLPQPFRAAPGAPGDPITPAQHASSGSTPVSAAAGGSLRRTATFTSAEAKAAESAKLAAFQATAAKLASKTPARKFFPPSSEPNSDPSRALEENINSSNTSAAATQRMARASTMLATPATVTVAGTEKNLARVSSTLTSPQTGTATGFVRTNTGHSKGAMSNAAAANTAASMSQLRSSTMANAHQVPAASPSSASASTTTSTPPAVAATQPTAVEPTGAQGTLPEAPLSRLASAAAATKEANSSIHPVLPPSPASDFTAKYAELRAQAQKSLSSAQAGAPRAMTRVQTAAVSGSKGDMSSSEAGGGAQKPTSAAAEQLRLRTAELLQRSRSNIRTSGSAESAAAISDTHADATTKGSLSRAHTSTATGAGEQLTSSKRSQYINQWKQSYQAHLQSQRNVTTAAVSNQEHAADT